MSVAGARSTNEVASHFEEGTTTQHFARIDGLRAIAALAVFFTHVSATKYAPGRPVDGFDNVVRGVLDELTIGVPIFFGISGFVLTRPFVERHVRAEPALRGNGYFIRRAFRIYPAYWVALLGSVFIIRGIVTLHDPWPWFANLALIQGYATSARYSPQFVGMIQAWTLVVEVTFYGFLALYASLLRGVLRQSNALRVQWFGINALIALTTGAYVWEHLGHAPVWVSVLPEQMPLFIIGMMLAVWSVKSAEQPRSSAVVLFIARHPNWCALVALGAFSGLAAMNTQGPPPWWAKLLLHLLIVCVLLIMAIGAPASSRVGRALGSRIAIFLGTVSYGIYLWHYVFVFWVAQHWFDATQGQTMMKVTATALPASILFAWLSYRCVERPMINLSRRLSRTPPKS